MREGVKVVVAIMVVLIIAFATIFIFSERLRDTNENILEPTEDDAGNSILSDLCRATHGDGSFIVSGTDCGKGKTTSTACNPTAEEGQSCCKCAN